MICVSVNKILINAANRLVNPTSHNLILTCSKSALAINTLPDSVQILKATKKSSSSAALKVKTISKAMKSYLERAKKHDDFLTVKTAEYEIGKQHLANMMGLDVNTLTQDDIDKAISYLLPSGLYDKKARPMMKPPAQLFPKEKAAQFDISGRPFSPFFYTKFANYYQALHDLAGKFLVLDAFEDKMLEKGILNPPSESVLNLSGGEWLKIDEMRALFLENITEEGYSFFINTLIRLASHPYAFKCKDDIWKYRKDFADVTCTEAIPPLMYDESGRPFMEMKGYRKHSTANVIVRGNGSGKISINGADLFYFTSLQDREQVMYPLDFSGMLGLVDVEVDVFGPRDMYRSKSSKAGAVRHGISMCLRSFVSADCVEKMRLAGLLTQDNRLRGRKKPGQKGNRGKYTWKKR